MADNVLFGFVGLEHLFANRSTEIDQRVIDRALAESLEEHNRISNGFVNAMSERTTERSIRFLLPNAGELQPLDEWGNPLPTRPAGDYTVGFPIQGGGDAYGNNRVTRALMTVEELNRHVRDIMERDARWLKRHALAALLDNTAWTFHDPQGDVTVQPLANNDTVTYNLNGGQTAADNHYLAGTAALSASTFTTIRRELTEHLSNAGAPVIVYVAQDVADEVTALSVDNGFTPVPDPDVTLGISTNRLDARMDRAFGDEVLGKIGQCWIVEWSDLPDNYMLAVAAGRTPLAYREYPAASLQGLFRESHSSNGNVAEERFIRYGGFGVLDRTAALVYQTGSASYTIPDGFATPLAV